MSDSEHDDREYVTVKGYERDRVPLDVLKARDEARERLRRARDEKDAARDAYDEAETTLRTYVGRTDAEVQYDDEQKARAEEHYRQGEPRRNVIRESIERLKARQRG